MRDMRSLARSLGLTKVVEYQKPLRAEEAPIEDSRYVDHSTGLSEAIDDDFE